MEARSQGLPDRVVKDQAGPRRRLLPHIVVYIQGTESPEKHALDEFPTLEDLPWKIAPTGAACPQLDTPLRKNIEVR